MPRDGSSPELQYEIETHPTDSPPGRAVGHIQSMPTDPRETNCYGFVAWSLHGRRPRPTRRETPNIAIHEKRALDEGILTQELIRRGIIATFYRPTLLFDCVSDTFVSYAPRNYEESDRIIQHEALVIGKTETDIILAEKQGQGSFAIGDLHTNSYGIEPHVPPLVVVNYQDLVQLTDLTRGQIGSALPDAYVSQDREFIWIDPKIMRHIQKPYGATIEQATKLDNLIGHFMAAPQSAVVHGLYSPWN